MSDLTREEQAGGGSVLTREDPNALTLAGLLDAADEIAGYPEDDAADAALGHLLILKRHELRQALAAAPQSPSPAEVGASPVVVPGAMPPHPLLYPNAEWCEEYSRWHGRYIRAVLADSRHDAVTGKVRAALSAPPADLVGELVGALSLIGSALTDEDAIWIDDEQTVMDVVNAALALAAQAEARANG
jgi:hypothetical protein